MGATDRAGRSFGQLFGQNDRLRARKPCLGIYQCRISGLRRVGSCRQFVRCRFYISLSIGDSLLRLNMRRCLDSFSVDLGQLTGQLASHRFGLSRLIKCQIGRIALRLELLSGIYGLGQSLLRRTFVLRSVVKRASKSRCLTDLVLDRLQPCQVSLNLLPPVLARLCLNK